MTIGSRPASAEQDGRDLDRYPETMTFQQVRHALGIGQAQLRRMQRTGALPPTLPGTRRLSREAVRHSLLGLSAAPRRRSIEDEEREILAELRAHGELGGSGAVP